MRNETTPPPEPTINSRQNQYAPFFYHWICGGRDGLTFSFILSKIVTGESIGKKSMIDESLYAVISSISLKNVLISMSSIYGDLSSVI